MGGGGDEIIHKLEKVFFIWKQIIFRNVRVNGSTYIYLGIELPFRRHIVFFFFHFVHFVELEKKWVVKKYFQFRQH